MYICSDAHLCSWDALVGYSRRIWWGWGRCIPAGPTPPHVRETDLEWWPLLMEVLDCSPAQQNPRLFPGPPTQRSEKDLRNTSTCQLDYYFPAGKTILDQHVCPCYSRLRLLGKVYMLIHVGGSGSSVLVLTDVFWFQMYFCRLALI